MPREAVPIIQALRRHFETQRARALLDAGGDAARATELLINRLLHEPSQALRELAAQGVEADERERAEKLLYDLFAIIRDSEGKKT